VCETVGKTQDSYRINVLYSENDIYKNTTRASSKISHGRTTLEMPQFEGIIETSSSSD